MLFRSFLTTALIFLLAISFTACGDDTSSSSTAAAEAEQSVDEKQRELDKVRDQETDALNGVLAQYARSSYDFKIAMTAVLQQYFVVRDALASDNLAQAKQQVLPFVEALGNVLDEEVNEEGLRLWQNQKGALIMQINALNNAEDITGARQAFSDLTNALIETQQSLGSTAPELYSIYCSSALNGQGAAWLSGDKTVKNPYSSSEPTCGEVSEDMATKIK